MLQESARDSNGKSIPWGNERRFQLAQELSQAPILHLELLLYCSQLEIRRPHRDPLLPDLYGSGRGGPSASRRARQDSLHLPKSPHPH
jgi:hypothetical protein